MVNNAYPADPKILCSSREPEILCGADRTVEIHFRVSGATDNHTAGALSVTGNDDAQWSLHDALKFEVFVLCSSLLGEHIGGFLMCGIESVLDLPPDSTVLYNDEVPGLHEAHA